MAEKMNFKKDLGYTDGSIISKMIIKKEAGNVTLFSFDKGQSLSEHTAPFDALVQIVDGKAEIHIDKVPYVLNEGESIVMPADHPHAVVALEKFKMLLTMIKSKV
ncbi:MAG: cupin domain-containing protein [bacterium]